MVERANDRGEEFPEGRVKIFLYVSSMWIASRESISRPGLACRDDERMVEEYEVCLSGSSQDGLNGRKHEAAICSAWLVWCIYRKTCWIFANRSSESTELFGN